MKNGSRRKHSKSQWTTLWNSATTSGFTVHFSFSGLDSEAYKEKAANDLSFTVTSQEDYTPDPSVTPIVEAFAVTTYSWGGL